MSHIKLKDLGHFESLVKELSEKGYRVFVAASPIDSNSADLVTGGTIPPSEIKVTASRVTLNMQFVK